MKKLIRKGNPIEFVNGCAHLMLDTWADFPAFVDENTNLKGYIFRGHPRSSFKLESTFLREFRSRSPGVPDSDDLIRQERRFRLATREALHRSVCGGNLLKSS